MPTFYRAIVLVFLTVLPLAGCMQATYTRPSHVGSPDQYSVIVSKPFDIVWKELIQYSAGTFFSIDNFEKDSGLITLTFGASKPQEFVTGGYWEASGSKAYKGDYVGFLNKYWNASLNGKMNIVVTERGPHQTQVTVRARYVFTLPSTGRSPGSTWSFDTGSCDTIVVSGAVAGIAPERTVCPTYRAERAIIMSVK